MRLFSFETKLNSSSERALSIYYYQNVKDRYLFLNSQLKYLLKLYNRNLFTILCLRLILVMLVMGAINEINYFII